MSKQTKPEPKFREHWHSLHQTQTFAPVLEQMRKKMVGTFGVTVVGHHVTLRFTDDRGISVEVSMLVSEAREYVPCCDGCGEPMGEDRRPFVFEQTRQADMVCGECAK